jgi:hypothetical protein
MSKYLLGKKIEFMCHLNCHPFKNSLPFPPVLVPNNRLLSAQKILLNQLNGPEALLLEDGGRTIYTGTGDGKLLRIVDGQIVASMPINGNYNGTCGVCN